MSVLGVVELLGRVARKPLNFIPPNAVFPVLTGEMGVLSGGDGQITCWRVGALDHGCWIGWYGREVRRALASMLRPGGVFFDVGASAGFFTLLAARLVGSRGRVVAFEPHPPAVAALTYHIARNALSNVTVVDAAVSDQDGVALLAGERSTAQLGHGTGISVATVSIDRLRDFGQVPDPDVIKLDVEGWEYPALVGMQRTLATTRPTLLIEFHGAMRDGIDWDTKSSDLLQSLGYRLIRLKGGETLAMPEGPTAGP